MNGADEVITMFRPVGLIELGLIYDSEMKEFPPRLPQQPIFYPVLNRNYASQIAEKWNTQSAPGFAGYVTKFDVRRNHAAQFHTQTVGNSTHQELWVPAERLAEFNAAIVGRIETVDGYFGAEFVGFVPDQFGLRGKNAVDQFTCLAAMFDYSGMDFICETGANAKAVFLNYPFWTTHDFGSHRISKETQNQIIDAITDLWAKRFPGVSLCDCRRKRL